MALEDDIKSLTAAINKNTEALLKGATPGSAGSAAPAASGKSTASKPPKEAAVTKHTAAQVQEAARAVKDKHGAEAAVALIQEHGGGNLKALLADDKKPNWDAFVEACNAKLLEEPDESIGGL
jgi:hypothetical protein